MSESANRDILEAVRAMAGVKSFKGCSFFMGTVTSVDEDNRQCDVESTLDGETVAYSDINLSPERNDGFIQIPAVDSTVFCVRTPDTEAYVLAFSDVSKIVCFIDSTNKYEFDTNGFIWNGGSFGGMAKTGVLATRLNLVENKVNAILTAIGATWIPVPNDGGAALKTLFAAVPLASPLSNTTQAQISDDKIKH